MLRTNFPRPRPAVSSSATACRALVTMPVTMLVALSWLVTGSCKREPGAAGASPDTIRIAVIPKGTTHDFWRRIHSGALDAGLRLAAAGGPKVEIIWKGPLKEDDTKEQQDIVDNFVNIGVDGICLAPLDKTALVPQVRGAREAGVPVVVFDSGVAGTAGEDFVAYVSTNNYEGGRLGGRRLGTVLGGKGRVALLRYQVGSDSTTQREQGFLDVLAAEYPNITVVSKDQYAGATEKDAFDKAQNLLTSLEGKIDGVFCPNESSASGMLGAMRQARLNGKVRFVGFDASEKLVAGIRSGDIDGLVLQDPIGMARQAVETLVAHLRKEPVETTIETEIHVLTPENVEEPSMVELHSPDLSKWLGN